MNVLHHNIMIQLGIILFYLIGYAVVVYAIAPAQHILLNTRVASSLIFLPHGVRTISVWFYGFKAVIGLTLGGLIAALLFHFPPTLVQAFMMSTASAFSAYLGFKTLSWLGLPSFHFERQSPSLYKEILLGGVLGSIFNMIAMSLLYADNLFSDLVATTTIVFLVGDIAGLAGCFLLMSLGFAIVDRVSHRRHRP